RVREPFSRAGGGSAGAFHVALKDGSILPKLGLFCRSRSGLAKAATAGSSVFTRRMKICRQVRFWGACKYRGFTGDLQGIGFFAFSGLRPPSPAFALRATADRPCGLRRAGNQTGLFCQSTRTLAAAATAAHGLRGGCGARWET